MTADEAHERLERNFKKRWPFFIKKDYCENDWPEFYDFLKTNKVRTFPHDGGFYFTKEEDYLLALMIK